jgi:hypothetical protein
MNLLIKPLNFPTVEERIKVFHYYEGRIGSFDNFLCRTTTLNPNILPHLLHSHAEAELIISFQGNLEIISKEIPHCQIHTSWIMEPGSFVYHSSNRQHTLRCTGPEAAKYLFFKWVRAGGLNDLDQGKSIHHNNGLDGAYLESSNGSRTMPKYDLATLTNGSMQAHFSCLEPGAGIETHRARNDIIVVLLEGKLHILNFPLKAPAFVFVAANTACSILNPGEQLSEYFFFEFIT